MQSAYAYHRQVENSYLVRVRDRRRWRELAAVVAVALPVAVALLVYIWLHVRVLDTAYDIRDLESRLDEKLGLAAKLSIETERLAALPAIERRAHDELGMVEPTTAATDFWTGEGFAGDPLAVATASRRATP